MRNNKYVQSGFTIVELMVSVAIIALISSITLANYHESNQVAKLNAETYKLANLVREVQDWALGVKKDSTGNLPGAWGLEFSDNPAGGANASVRIVRYDALGGELTASYVERSVAFATGVTVGDLVAGGNHPARVFLAFIPPDPVTLICQTDLMPSSCTATVFDVVLHDRFSTRDKTIRINAFGLIDVN